MIQTKRATYSEFDGEEIEHLERVFRLNLINSVTGIKPGNLIGTRSKDGQTNLAIFSSVIHLGSDPALIGIVSRPNGKIRRDTYQNIIETGEYTINSIPNTKTKNAHYTSFKFDRHQSEFDECGFEEEYKRDFKAPFVSNSAIQIGLKFEQELPIAANGTILIIGKVVKLSVMTHMLDSSGQLDLQMADVAGISGLNTYYSLKKEANYPYPRANQLPEFD